MSIPAPGVGPVPDLRAYLLGAWSLSRSLLDRSTGSRGRFTGVATFTGTDDGGLHYREHGTLSWTPAGAQTFTATASREYLLRPAETPDMLDMFFPDGRPFHRMGFANLTSQDRHWCDPDTYRVSYTLIGPEEFRYSWDVTGPAKNQLLESVLHRQPASADDGPG